MKNLPKYLLLTLAKPRELFVLILEKPNLKHAFGILFAIGLLYGLQIILNQDFAGTYHLTERSGVSLIFYSIGWALICVIFGGMGLSIETLYVKYVFLKFLHTAVSFRVLLSVLIFTWVPSLLKYTIAIFWPRFTVSAQAEGMRPIFYDVTSLAQFASHHIYSSFPKMFIFLASIELFGIWCMVLEVIAAATIGKISYKKSFFIMLPFWIVTSLLNIQLGYHR